MRKEYRYFNDKKEGIPSVTELIGMINKPYLIQWANSLGFKGIKYKDESEKYTNIGTLVHKLNELYITSNCSVKGVIEEITNNALDLDLKNMAIQSFKNFKKWYNLNKENIKPLYNEYTIIGDKYAGTIDFICDFNGKTTIIDFKTSKEISVDYFIQLMGYYQLCLDKGILVEKVAILRQDKYKDNYDYLEYDVERLKDLGYLDIFNMLLNLYYTYEKVDEVFSQDIK